MYCRRIYLFVVEIESAQEVENGVLAGPDEERVYGLDDIPVDDLVAVQRVDGVTHVLEYVLGREVDALVEPLFSF